MVISSLFDRTLMNSGLFRVWPITDVGLRQCTQSGAQSSNSHRLHPQQVQSTLEVSQRPFQTRLCIAGMVDGVKCCCYCHPSMPLLTIKHQRIYFIRHYYMATGQAAIDSALTMLTHVPAISNGRGEGLPPLSSERRDIFSFKMLLNFTITKVSN